MSLGSDIGSAIDELVVNSGVGENLTLVSLKPHKSYNDGGMGDGWVGVFSYWTQSGQRWIRITNSGGRFSREMGYFENVSVEKWHKL